MLIVLNEMVFQTMHNLKLIDHLMVAVMRFCVFSLKSMILSTIVLIKVVMWNSFFTVGIVTDQMTINLTVAKVD